MKKFSIVIVVLVLLIFQSFTAHKENRGQKLKSFSLEDVRSFPSDILESVESSLPNHPDIKINFDDVEEHGSEGPSVIISEDSDSEESYDHSHLKQRPLSKINLDEIHDFL